MSKKYTEATEAVVAEPVKTVNSQPVEQYMYIGENLIKAGLMKYQVYKGGKPAIIETLKVKYPLIEQLFVKISDIEKARVAIMSKGTALYLANQQIINGGEN